MDAINQDSNNTIGIAAINTIWRYAIVRRGLGGIVLAESYDEAVRKVIAAYDMTDDTAVNIWEILEDEYYRKSFPDVIEVYGS